MSSAPSSKAGLALRDICRQNVPAAKRRQLWLSLSSIYSDCTHDYMYTAAKVFGSANPLPSKVYSVPFLGVAPYSVPESCIHLLRQPNFDMSAAHDRVVCCLAQTLGLSYCPMVPNLAFVLLEYLNEAETFAVIKSLYRHGGAGSTAALVAPPAAAGGASSGAPGHAPGGAAAGASRGSGGRAASASLQMFFTSREEEYAFALAFLKHVKSRFPKLNGHIERLIGAGHAILDMFIAWFRGFFSGWLPHADVVRCVDLFLSEGPKSLFRMGLAWLKIRKKQLKKCADGDSFEMALRDWPIGGPMASDDIPYRFDTMVSEGFGLRNLSKASIFAAMDASREAARELARAAAAASAQNGAASSGSWAAPLLLNDSALLFSKAVVADGSELVLFSPGQAAEANTAAARMAAGGSSGAGGGGAKQWAEVEPHLARPFVAHTAEQLRGWAHGADSLPPQSPAHGLLSACSAHPRSMLTAPQVATLMGLLPRSQRQHHCAVLFSSSRHSATLDTLYAHTAGVAPVMLLLQVSVTIPPSGQATQTGTASVTASAASGGTGSVYTSTVAVFLSGGLPAPGQGGLVSGAWTGHRGDFVLQLHPEIAHFVPQKGNALTVLPDTGAAGDIHRQPFQIERMLACTKDMLLLGGGAPGVPPALSISADFNTATASALFLEDLCVPVHLLPGSGGLNEVTVHIGTVEAMGFVDGFGAFCSPPEHVLPTAAKLAQSAVAAATAADAAYKEATEEQ